MAKRSIPNAISRRKVRRPAASDSAQRRTAMAEMLGANNRATPARSRRHVKARFGRY